MKNQKIIEIKIRDGFLIDDLGKARMLLNGASFKIYTIFYFECAGIIPFSPQYFKDNFNVYKGTAHKAFAELQEKGYIVNAEENRYIFYSAGAPIWLFLKIVL